MALLLAACVGLLVAGCGGSSPRSPFGRSRGPVPPGTDKRALAYTSCMRAHGVRNFPDPTPGSGGNGIFNAPRGTISLESMAFLVASNECSVVGPGRVSRGARAAVVRERKFLGLVRCMRAHGVPDYPFNGGAALKSAYNRCRPWLRNLG